MNQKSTFAQNLDIIAKMLLILFLIVVLGSFAFLMLVGHHEEAMTTAQKQAIMDKAMDKAMQGPLKP